jgi:twitching motility protein PilT
MELDEICRQAMRRGASDIHLKAGLHPMLRVRGSLEPLSSAPRYAPEELGRMAWGIMTDAQRARFKSNNDLDMAWAVPGVGRFRVNVFRQRTAVGMVLRTIPTEVRTVDELRLPPVCKDISMYPRGLVLVTGTTGSGKSTTLAALIEEVNREASHHVITIEDPIEFVYKDKKSVINQREVGVDTESFATGLRAALRQDPDVILVGELRDRETVEIALQAADTGHLVLGTLHTIDAPESINRITGFFEPHHQQHIRHQLSSVLRAVLSQRLIPNRSGGRAAAIEIMLNTGSVAECIADMARLREIPDFIAKGHKVYRTQTFDQAVYRLLKEGAIEQEQALKAVNNPDELLLRLRGIGDDWD